MAEFVPIPGHEKFLAKKVLVSNPEGALPYPGVKLSVHYTGTLGKDGSKFDSSVDRNEKFEFTLGVGQVIKGWDVGMGTMRIGEKALLKIDSSYGYGAQGAGGAIPPNAELIFEVEVFGFSGGVCDKIGRRWANTKVVGSGSLTPLQVAQSVAAFSGCTSDVLKFLDSQMNSGKTLVKAMLAKGQPDSVQKLVDRFQAKLETSLRDQFEGKAISAEQAAEEDPVIGTVTIVGLIFPEERKHLEQFEVFVSYAGKGTLFRASSFILPEKLGAPKQPLSMAPVPATDLEGEGKASKLAQWASGSFNKLFLDEEVFTKYWTEACGFPERPDAEQLAKLDIGNEGEPVTPYIATVSGPVTASAFGRSSHFAEQAIQRNMLPTLY